MDLLAPVDLTMLNRLSRRLTGQAGDLRELDDYYNGRQQLVYMQEELAAEISDRVHPVIVNWPQLVVDSVEERLDVEGFQIGNDLDKRLWRWWQANDLDEKSQLAHLDALIQRRAYAIVGTRADDPATPLITVESPQQVLTHHDPATGAVAAAIKQWVDDDRVVHATFYSRDRTVRLKAGGGGWVLDGDPDDHGFGVVPVVPLVNRPRTLNTEGASELAAVLPLSNAACKIATDMMVSAEFHAIPRIWGLGFTDEDFKDPQGNPVSKWKRIAGRIWSLKKGPGDAQMGQFPEADLRNFHDTINALARLVASLAGLPPHFLGYADANPASADAIRSAETRLVKRAERKQRAFGGSWEQVMRLALLVVDGELPDGVASLETVWRDAATPTVAQKADATVKLYGDGNTGIIPRRQARRDLGYTAAQIADMEADDERAAARVLAGDFASLVGPKPPTPEPRRQVSVNWEQPGKAP